jgi:hypothetical protein
VKIQEFGLTNCFGIRRIAYAYFEDEPRRQSAAKLPRRDEAPICAAIICASIRRAAEPSRFPWTKGFDYDSDSIQYSLNFTLHALGFGYSLPQRRRGGLR